MFARITRIQAPPERVEEGIRFLGGQSGSMAGLRGIKGAYLLVDRESGDAMTVTFWENMDDLHASQETARQLLIQAEALGVMMQGTPEVYEAIEVV